MDRLLGGVWSPLFIRSTSRIPSTGLAYPYFSDINFPKHLNARAMTLLKNVAISIEKSHTFLKLTSTMRFYFFFLVLTWNTLHRQNIHSSHINSLCTSSSMCSYLKWSFFAMSHRWCNSYTFLKVLSHSGGFLPNTVSLQRLSPQILSHSEGSPLILKFTMQIYTFHLASHMLPLSDSSVNCTLH